MTTLTAIEAAEYLGMEVGPFRRAVDRKELPGPLIRSRPARWSKVQLDWALEGRIDTPPVLSGVDPIMERLNALHDEVRK